MPFPCISNLRPPSFCLCFVPFIALLDLCFVYDAFKLLDPLKREKESLPWRTKKVKALLKHFYGGFSWTLQTEWKNKCERIFQGRNMLLQFAGNFPSCSRKAASPLLTREARRPRRTAATQQIKTGLPPPPVRVQTALNNQIEKTHKWN